MARIKPQALLQQSKKKKGPSRINVTTVVLYSLIVVVMGVFLFATYRHWAHRFVGIFAVGSTFVILIREKLRAHLPNSTLVTPFS